MYAGLTLGPSNMVTPPVPTVCVEPADAEKEILVQGEEADRAEQEYQGADAHVIEEIFGGLAASLPCFMNLGGGYRFRERQLRIFHHDAPHQRNEEHAQHATHHHQGGRFPVSVADSK